MMRGLDRRDGWFPRFDTFNEIALVIVRFVEGHLAFIFRQFPEPIDVRRIVSAPVHPDPAIGPNPFRSAFDVRMPAGNDHRDVVRILAGDAILGASIPNRVFRWELADAFD